MTLLSITYGVFLLSILGIYWLVDARSLRLWIILVASLIFYSSLQLQYVPLLVLLMLATFFMGRAIATPMNWNVSNEEWQFAQPDWNRRRLRLLWLGISLNVLLLLGFKYILPFLSPSEGSAIGAATSTASLGWLDTRIIAPLGLSYFVFECIAYLVDVYRGAPATSNMLEFSAYKLFFAKLLSGPITRFHPIDAQFQALRVPSVIQVSDGLWLIAWGAVKKLLLADHIAILVNLSFSNLDRAGSGDLWLATFAYGLQLYLDFSGYVDVALGTALLLGLSLPQNFNFPYFSTSIADFWRRWHMTLGDWLRNYLYFPLGGSRKGLVRTCINLVIVMLIAGIWHNPGWGFVIWGALHGIALATHRITSEVSRRQPWLEHWWKSMPGTVSAWAITQFSVFFAWLFFRLPNPQDFGLVLQRLWGYGADVQFAQKVYIEELGMNRPQITLALGGIVALMAGIYAFRRGLKVQLNWPVKILLVPILIYLAWLLAPAESLPYIYFDF
ncbi:MAG: MBOAT family O-acyltransferase [Elainellaceae cyanobacterium]